MPSSFSVSHYIVLLAALAICVFLVSSANVQYIINGGFETGDTTAWSVFNAQNVFLAVEPNGAVVPGSSPLTAQSFALGGNFFLAFGTNSSVNGNNFQTINVTLTQTVTIPEFNDLYLLTYYTAQVVTPATQSETLAVFAGFGNNVVQVIPNPVNNTFTSTLAYNGLPNAFWVQHSVFIQAPNVAITAPFTLTFVAAANSGFWLLDNVTLVGPSLVVGDPQFVGLRGQSFQVHGMDKEVYNLISDKDLQVNSRFAFLTEGTCPTVNGRVQKNCWSHAGSYLGAIGIQQRMGDKLEQLTIESGDAKTGFAEISLNGQKMKVGEIYENEAFSVSYNNTHTLSVQTPTFAFKFDNSDFFINQRVISNVPLSQLTAHGLFGQTHERKVYHTALKYIAGEVDDYVIADNTLFGSEFLYNQFKL